MYWLRRTCMLAGIAALRSRRPPRRAADYCEGEDVPITAATADSAGLRWLSSA